MNENRSELIFVLDRSGSMEHLTTETIGGFNSLIEKQKMDRQGESHFLKKGKESEADKKEIFVTTVLFDDQYELLYNHCPIDEVSRMTKREYYARGCTALLDAVGKTINSVGKRLADTPEDERPQNILFVITTDGYENASLEYTKSRVKEMIEHQQNVYNWKFLFLGANIDAVGEADSLGIRQAGACRPSATVEGVRSSFRAVSNIATFMCAPAPAGRTRIERDEDFDEACAREFESIR